MNSVKYDILYITFYSLSDITNYGRISLETTASARSSL